MVNQDHLLDTLVHLLSDVSPFTRRYASAALFTLACTYANTSVMARHCNGGILEALRKVLLNDPIDEALVNAAEALLTWLAICRLEMKWSKVWAITQDFGFIITLGINRLQCRCSCLIC